MSSPSGTTETAFQFDASGSTDQEDPVSTLQVRWDWENDGTWDTEYSTTKTASHQYGTAGTKTVKLEVKDTGGLTGTATRTLPVSVPNTPPTACFTVDPPSGTAGTTFQFDASCCTDLEDTPSTLQVRWDWENDGTWDTEYSTTRTASHQYGTAGTKTAKLEAKDTGGLTGTATRTLPVSVPNTPPTAFFTATPPSGTTETTFQFDASESTDLEDQVSALLVRWDWENDGAWDTAWSTTKTASHQYETVGTKTASLEVKDTGGLTDTLTQPMTVSNTPPTACFTVDPPSGTAGTTFLFDASCCTDLEDTPSTLQVRWDWENDGTWDTPYATTKTANHLYPTEGIKTVNVEVKDTEGLTNSETHTVPVSLAGVLVSSYFEESTEEWVSYDNGTASDGRLTRVSEGDPGSCAKIRDDLGGGVAYYFQAPSKFHGDFSAAIGGSLGYHLRVSNDNNDPARDDADVVLEGAGLSLYYLLPSVPSADTAWHTYTIHLHPDAGWRKNGSQGTPATLAEISSVLSNISSLRIRGEYSTSSSDYALLDAVRIEVQ